MSEPVAHSPAERRQQALAMRWSLGIGVLMFGLKVGAYLLTGSAAILSDAAESVVHVVAVAFATYSLALSFRPPDARHPYGHAKISFFSAGFEGAMIILAALFIIYESIRKWVTGFELERLDAGLGLTALAVVLNGGLGWWLVRLGKQQNSLILRANGRHVLTDCYTSIAVIAALLLVMFTGWKHWDPLFGILVALNILWSGGHLIRESYAGLMDEAEPTTQAAITAVVERETQARGLRFHALRHRNLGNATQVDLHLLFPAATSIREAHAQATAVEAALMAAFPEKILVASHLEPQEGHDRAHAETGHVAKEIAEE